jgi:hypothetical protein
MGQNNKAQNRQREFTVTFKDAGGTQQAKRVTTQTDWVIPTGGGYFFSPSLDALEMMANS